jgi:hypothetical protein
MQTFSKIMGKVSAKHPTQISLKQRNPGTAELKHFIN